MIPQEHTRTCRARRKGHPRRRAGWTVTVVKVLDSGTPARGMAIVLCSIVSICSVVSVRMVGHTSTWRTIIYPRWCTVPQSTPRRPAAPPPPLPQDRSLHHHRDRHRPDLAHTVHHTYIHCTGHLRRTCLAYTAIPDEAHTDHTLHTSSLQYLPISLSNRRPLTDPP